MTGQAIQDFWLHHGILFLVFITFFPRLTLLFSSVPFGSIFWWLGFIFAPRILVAFLATITYGTSNPILVAISWFVALSGESGEKYFVRKRVNFVRYKRGPTPSRQTSKNNSEIIEPDYKRLE